MSNQLKPGIVLLESNSEDHEYFYVTVIDLPNDTAVYPSPADIQPVVDGENIVYDYPFDIPEEYDGEVISYMLIPQLVTSAGPDTPPDISEIQFKAKNRTKTGDASGIRTHPLVDTASAEYSCDQRCFVIQADGNPGVYFVGTLVDMPHGHRPNGVTINHSDVVINLETTEPPNPAGTHVVVVHNSASYQPSSNTASYERIWVEGHEQDGKIGTFIGPETDLYADPFKLNQYTAISK